MELLFFYSPFTLNNNTFTVLQDLPEIKRTSEGQIKKHLSLPPVLVQRRDIWDEMTSGKNLSTGQNTDTHRRMAGMVLKCKHGATHFA